MFTACLEGERGIPALPSQLIRELVPCLLSHHVAARRQSLCTAVTFHFEYNSWHTSSIWLSTKPALQQLASINPTINIQAQVAAHCVCVCVRVRVCVSTMIPHYSTHKCLRTKLASFYGLLELHPLHLTLIPLNSQAAPCSGNYIMLPSTNDIRYLMLMQ
jgi:hypothetical protein